MSGVIIPNDEERITHGFGIEDTDEGIFRRISIGKTAGGKYILKMETREPSDPRMRVLRFGLSRRGLAMLAKVMDEAETKMHTHPVHTEMKDL